jgi:hypothetical protein
MYAISRTGEYDGFPDTTKIEARGFFNFRTLAARDLTTVTPQYPGASYG